MVDVSETHRLRRLSLAQNFSNDEHRGAF